MGQIKNIKLHIVTDIKVIPAQATSQPTNQSQTTSQPTNQSPCRTTPEKLLMFTSHENVSITNNIISAKDHASVQISVAEVDEEGRMTGGFKTYAFCGKVRAMGEADDSFTNLCLKDGVLPSNYNI